MGEVLAYAAVLRALGYASAATDLAADAYLSMHALAASYLGDAAHETLVARIREAVGAQPFAAFGFEGIQRWAAEQARCLGDGSPAAPPPGYVDAFGRLPGELEERSAAGRRPKGPYR
jgi:hypothetical protein